ncbi:hypothetical protein SAMN04489725_101137 [Alicyclobacillus hesperidum]|uniref:Uncharacterized protein n=1 Tax=Alicyclobacillus hesperidum TaxID=89784 RepID=A0A1H2Q897_9BACL|nr:hypothetical protein SAMN04489725_101137 [Alicyclobacillus hesperidum]
MNGSCISHIVCKWVLISIIHVIAEMSIVNATVSCSDRVCLDGIAQTVNDCRDEAWLAADNMGSGHDARSLQAGGRSR